MRTLVAIPVYNEAATVERVARRVRSFVPDVLIVDDGSTDGTCAALDRLEAHGIGVIRHKNNRGYGATLIEAFARAAADGYDWVITIDCDEQHEPESLPDFLRVQAENRHDIISGSRYLDGDMEWKGAPPPERRQINHLITDEINQRLGLGITDAFCGYKSHRVSAVNTLDLKEPGYAFPMQFWVRAAAARLSVAELPVRLIYNDPNRTFGSGLDDAEHRLLHYRELLHRELRCAESELPPEATRDLVVERCA